MKKGDRNNEVDLRLYTRAGGAVEAGKPAEISDLSEMVGLRSVNVLDVADDLGQKYRVQDIVPEESDRTVLRVGLACLIGTAVAVLIALVGYGVF